MTNQVLLITPPFTQLNTPYPATAYLKGFLRTKNISSFQVDAGLEVILKIFCREGLEDLFKQVQEGLEINENISRIIALQELYKDTIDATISFLQGKLPALANRIAARNFLPEAGRFKEVNYWEEAFGSMSIQDKAKHIATLYLEDLSDLIKEAVDPHFGFSRYAESMGRSANSFDQLSYELNQPPSFIDRQFFAILENCVKNTSPTIVAISVPFPGNLYASLRCGQWVKKYHPEIKVVMGGGFANTELRSLKDPRVFSYFDFITLDDGEAPIEKLISFINGEHSKDQLRRTYLLEDGQVKYYNNSTIKDYKQGEVGTPDYSDFLLDRYISAIEVVNPMHRMWSDGRWNKLTMAHGCYWGKCTFCDISLDYIRLYEPVAAQLICDRMETMIAQTGETGFHFVDEAAPPSLMRALSIEIIRRKLVVVWWANIRFEKSFTADLCYLLKTAGCVAVSGGLEVASERLLSLIEKGITIPQVAQVNRNFTTAGIMVHAYLMYGFPSQTAQETIDSLEMVRQLFKSGVLSSAFWHRFALTVHSPVAKNPEKYKIHIPDPLPGDFANNDLEYKDLTGANHDLFSYGLKKSLLNYMHGICLDNPLQSWFDFSIPKVTVPPDFIEQALNEPALPVFRPAAKIIWLGGNPKTTIFTKSKKGNSWQMLSISFETNKETVEIKLGLEQGQWFASILDKLSVYNDKIYSLQEVKDSYEAAGLEDFELFWDNKPINTLNKIGLLRL